MTKIKNIRTKKKFGQHFLRNKSVVHEMLKNIEITNKTNIFEIGCGDGFLTESILETKINKLWGFEIDPEWANLVKDKIQDPRLTIFEQDILQTDFSIFEKDKPWTILANLPYQITFPILHLLQKNRHILKEGVIMIQEEVAQKLAKTRGKGYGYNSLFFSYYFDLKLLTKISPTDFVPPPRVFSRLIYLKPKKNLKTIKNGQEFWNFIKICFKQPRRTLKNNLIQSHYAIEKIPEKVMVLRAQQMTMDDLLKIWNLLA
jgi:16S rRNA (adenine1518-N6/adenine1519-N6)-dimethyltransferase